MDAIIQVVRCFEDSNIEHVMDTVDPVRDIEIINTELVLADLESVEKRKAKQQKAAKSGDKKAIAEVELLERLEAHLNTGKTVVTLDLTPEEKAAVKGFFLLTAKPTLFACNVAEGDLATADTNEFVQQVRAYVAEHHDTSAVVVSAEIESELVTLSPEERAEYLAGLGVTDTGASKLIQEAYHLLGLRTFLTTGEKETRAWTIHAGDKAPQAAGVIHSDFEKAFISAECVSYDELVAAGSFAKAREQGKIAHGRQRVRDAGRRCGGVQDLRLARDAFRSALTSALLSSRHWPICRPSSVSGPSLRANELQHLAADCFEHAANLPVASFGDGDFEKRVLRAVPKSADDGRPRGAVSRARLRARAAFSWSSESRMEAFTR